MDVAALNTGQQLAQRQHLFVKINRSKFPDEPSLSTPPALGDAPQKAVPNQVMEWVPGEVFTLTMACVRGTSDGQHGGRACHGEEEVIYSVTRHSIMCISNIFS